MLAKSKFTTEDLTTARATVDKWHAHYDAAPDAFVLALDRLFVHRQRGLEDKRGTLKELRALCERIEAGETAAAPDAAGYTALVDATFAELHARFI